MRDASGSRRECGRGDAHQEQTRDGDAPGLGSCTAGGRREPLGHGRHGLTKVRKDARDEAAATLQVRRTIVEFQENGFFGGARREESNVELREDDEAGWSPLVPQLELLEEWEATFEHFSKISTDSLEAQLRALHISLFR